MHLGRAQLLDRVEELLTLRLGHNLDLGTTMRTPKFIAATFNAGVECIV